MLRKLACAVVVLCFAFGVALAEEMKGVVLKVDKDKLTFKEGKAGAEAKTFDVAPDVKVYRYVSKTEKELDPDGIKAPPLPNLPKGGALAVINVVDGKVTEISLPGKKKKN
jgi:hypothetical protein